MCLYMCALAPVEIGRELMNPLELDYEQLWASWHAHWEPNSDPVQEEWALLTEKPYLQPNSLFKWAHSPFLSLFF